MNVHLPRFAALGVAGLLCAGLLIACDDDPSSPDPEIPTFTIVTGDTIGQQEPIRITFSGPVTAETALDPANFVVTNECNGLRVPGSLRLDGNTLIFSPSIALPFLTPLGIRVQNIQGVNGATLAVRTFRVTTQAPPVRDVSWTFLNSPTDETITGVSFLDRNLGYISSFGGVIYRTTDGGNIFAARFKRIDVTGTFDLRALTADSLYMVASIQLGGVLRNALLRSTNGGLTFDTVRTVSQIVYSLSAVRRPTSSSVLSFGGQFGSSAVYHYDISTGVLTQAAGLTTSTSYRFNDVSLSPNGANALVTYRGVGVNLGTGLVSRSTDGGLSYTDVTPLPAGTFGIRGGGFINNTEALAVGDSSVVLRLNVVTGAVTRLGAAAGIPQTVRDPANQDVTTYSFNEVYFAPGSQIGWVVGRFRRQRLNVPDVFGGVILMSRDGGNTFTRQAISGAPDNGLSFSPVDEVFALAPDFAALAGERGLVAARKSDVQTGAGACTFTTP